MTFRIPQHHHTPAVSDILLTQRSRSSRMLRCYHDGVRRQAGELTQCSSQRSYARTDLPTRSSLPVSEPISLLFVRTYMHVGPVYIGDMDDFHHTLLFAFLWHSGCVIEQERRTKGRQNGGNHSLQFSQAVATLTLFAGRNCPCAPTGLLSVSIEYRSEIHSGVPLPPLGLIVLAFWVVCGVSFLILSDSEEKRKW